MLWLIIARDGDDDGAPARRLHARERHLAGARALQEAGRLPIGGAILDGGGDMIGSMLVIEADDEMAARAIVDRDIYSTDGVWQHVEIHPFRRAI